MTCDENYDLKKSLVGVLEIVGFFIGSFVLTPLADTIGRKKITFILTLI